METVCKSCHQQAFALRRRAHQRAGILYARRQRLLAEDIRTCAQSGFGN